MKKYKAKFLISGFKIGQKTADKYVAVPAKLLNDDVIVTCGTEVMAISRGAQPVTSRTFDDKFGRGSYTLNYFKWEVK